MALKIRVTLVIGLRILQVKLCSIFRTGVVLFIEYAISLYSNCPLFLFSLREVAQKWKFQIHSYLYDPVVNMPRFTRSRARELARAEEPVVELMEDEVQDEVQSHDTQRRDELISEIQATVLLFINKQIMPEVLEQALNEIYQEASQLCAICFNVIKKVMMPYIREWKVPGFVIVHVDKF